MMEYGLIKKISWLIIASASLCIGLDALGFDMEKLLCLQSYDLTIRYIVGCVGAASIVMFFAERIMGNCCKK